MNDPWFQSELETLRRYYQLIPSAQRHLYTSDIWELVQLLRRLTDCALDCSVIEFVALITEYDRKMVQVFLHKRE